MIWEVAYKLLQEFIVTSYTVGNCLHQIAFSQQIISVLISKPTYEKLRCKFNAVLNDHIFQWSIDEKRTNSVWHASFFIRNE